MNSFFLTQQGTLRFRFRPALTFIGVGILIAVISSLGIYYTTRGQIIAQIQQRALTTAKLTAFQQNGDLHSILVNPSDENGTVYSSISNRNFQISQADPEITSIYTMRLDSNGNIYFVVDVVREDIARIRPPAKLGEFYTDASPTLSQNFGTMTDAIAEDDVYTDSWGTTLSAYAPFYRSDGSLEGIVGVDISAAAIENAQANIFRTALILIFGFIPVLTLIGVGLGTAIARPVEAISQSAERIIAGDFSKEVQITSKDEFGQLASTFNKMSGQLRSLITDLEGRVAERTVALSSRTQELEKLAAQEERRAVQLQAIAQVSAIINSVQNPDELLPRITAVISDQFGYYHVGIFLLSKDGRYAVLRAANSAGGQKMLARNHRLRVGASGIVGFVTGTGVPRIALDVGDDAVFFDNPDMPDTRSEVAVPLRLGKQIIGALDVQHTRAAAFTQTDVDLLSVLADQVTIAIENARVFDETRKSLAEAQNIYKQYLKTQWSEFIKEEKLLGYTYGQAKTRLLETPEETTEIIEAKRSGEMQLIRDETSRVVIPIKLRGEAIGALSLKSQSEREWTEDEIDIIRAVAERVAIAAENARLVTETQRKAAKEETIGQITSKISSSVNMRNILQTTVEELGRALPGSEIVIQLREQEKQAQ